MTLKSGDSKKQPQENCPIFLNCSRYMQMWNTFLGKIHVEDLSPEIVCIVVVVRVIGIAELCKVF